MKDYNRLIFDKINSWQGRNPWLDAFGRAGAEWVIVAMLGWYAAATFLACWPDWKSAFGPIIILAGVWVLTWCVDVAIGYFVHEMRPHITEPATRQLFKPMMGWKSFPSDHTMTAFLIFFTACVFGLAGTPALFVLALWAAFGRMFSGVHYPIDIIGGISTAGVAAIWLKFILILI
ncbi:MAG: phosphatase PAP2 family protein [Patescibacteria group bacterium]